MLNKKKIMISLITLMFAVILCGASAAATPGQSVVGKTASTYGNNVTIVIHSVSHTTAKNQQLYVNSSAKNLANKNSKAFYAKYYLVSKKTLLGSKIYLGTQSFLALHKGNYDNVVSFFTIPKNINIGAYYVAAVADKNHVSFSTDKTVVYPKQIDSGVSYVKTYGQFKWHTYLMKNNSVIIYSQFYNPNLGHMMKQTTQIGSLQKGLLYMFIVPKIAPINDNYWTILPSISTPENYYKYIFKPDMVKNGPNH